MDNHNRRYYLRRRSHGSNIDSVLKACKNGELRWLRRLLSVSAICINHPDENGLTALHHAVLSEKASLSLVQLLLEHKANIHQTTPSYATPLHLSLERSPPNNSIVQLLLKSGASINHRNAQGETPLFLACASNNFEAANLLLQHKAYPNSLSYDQTDLSHWVIYHDNLALLKLLIQYGALPRNTSVYLEKSLLHWSVQYERLALSKFLIRKHPGLVACIDVNGCQPLHEAAIKGSLTMVQLMIQSGANVNSTNNSGETILHMAASHANPSLLIYLLKEVKMKINHLDKRGRNALHSAALHNQAPNVAIDLLSSLGFESQDKYGHTVLHIALKGRNLAAVRYLLSRNANIYAKDPHGSDMFDYAVRTGSSDIVTTLLNAVDNPIHAQIYCNRMLRIAARYGYKEIFMGLVKKSGVHILDEQGWNLLHYLSTQRVTARFAWPLDESLSLMQFVTQQGVDINSQTNHLETPLHLASMTNNVPAVGWLLNKKAAIHTHTSYSYSPFDLAVQYSAFQATQLLYMLQHPEVKNIKAYAATRKNREALQTHQALLLNYSDKDSLKLLFLAAHKSEPQIMQFLLENNREVWKDRIEILEGKILNETGRRLLALTAKNKNIQVASLLLDKTLGFPALRLNASKMLLLREAISPANKNIELVHWLLPQLTRTLLPVDITHTAAHYFTPSDFLKLVKVDPSLWVRTDDKKNTVLHHSASSGNLELAEFLIASCQNLLYLLNTNQELPINCAVNALSEQLKTFNRSQAELDINQCQQLVYVIRRYRENAALLMFCMNLIGPHAVTIENASIQKIFGDMQNNYAFKKILEQPLRKKGSLLCKKALIYTNTPGIEVISRLPFKDCYRLWLFTQAQLPQEIIMLIISQYCYEYHTDLTNGYDRIMSYPNLLYQRINPTEIYEALCAARVSFTEHALNEPTVSFFRYHATTSHFSSLLL